MSKLVIASRVMSSGLFALIAAGAVGSAVGCSKPEEEKKQAWSCTSDEVPMGEVVRCTSSALTADGPVGDAVGGTTDGTTLDGTTTNGATTDGTTDDGTTGGADGTTTYECGPGSLDGPDCPPADTTGGTTDGTTDGTTTSGGTTSGGTSGTDNGTEGASSSGGASSGGGKSNGHTTDGTGPDSSGGGSGGGSSHGPGPDECAYVPDLEYCGGSGSGTSSGDTTSGGTECSKPNCTPPGQDKKGGTTDGTGASSSSGGSDGASSGGAGGGGGKGKHYTCKKDKKGNKSCVSTPDCAPGTHPSKCGACVSDSDGTADCVPPSEGGCWVTGGGFIEGASLVPAAAADGKDNFGGNAKPMKAGDVKGHWNHVDHGTGNHAKGRPEYIMCRTTDGPGPGQPGGKKGLVANQVYFGGHAQWRTAANATWNDGYWFDVVAEDHGEPGNTSALKNGEMPDSYHFTIRKIDDPTAGASGVVVYETRGDLSGGNIQLHPSNNGHPAVNSPLPAWVSVEP